MNLNEALAVVAQLNPADKLRLIDELARQLRTSAVAPEALPEPLATGAALRNALADLGPPPSFEDIEQTRREMGATFPREDQP